MLQDTVKTQRTSIEDLSPTVVELSKEDLRLVAGGEAIMDLMEPAQFGSVGTCSHGTYKDGGCYADVEVDC